jgi:large subunit ribosomal protein L13
MTVIDATNNIAGRLSSTIAKRALLGEKIDLVNCEKAVITGKKEAVFTKYREKKERGNPLKGPFLSMMPDRFFRRIVRGMLPYKQEKGKKAFKNVMCYMGVPEKLKSEKIERVKETNITNSKSINYVTIEKICKQLKK